MGFPALHVSRLIAVSSWHRPPLLCLTVRIPSPIPTRAIRSRILGIVGEPTWCGRWRWWGRRGSRMVVAVLMGGISRCARGTLPMS